MNENERVITLFIPYVISILYIYIYDEMKLVKIKIFSNGINQLHFTNTNFFLEYYILKIMIEMLSNEI